MGFAVAVSSVLDAREVPYALDPTIIPSSAKSGSYRQVNAIDAAKADYVSGNIDVPELEKRVEYALAGFPRGSSTICL